MKVGDLASLPDDLTRFEPDGKGGMVESEVGGYVRAEDALITILEALEKHVMTLRTVAGAVDLFEGPKMTTTDAIATVMLYVDAIADRNNQAEQAIMSAIQSATREDDKQ